jgi:AcrR family transcriptional regulator
MVENRPRNAAATREAILASARMAFAERGYDGAGVREIAAGAGVTAMLVNRYFGSKEQLFAEAIAAANASPTIATAAVLASASPGEAIARALVGITRQGDAPLEGFKMLVNSASSPRAAEIGRGVIEAGHYATILGALSGPDREQRAALVLAMVAGVQMMRQSIGLTPLAEADPETLVRLLAPLFDRLMTA